MDAMGRSFLDKMNIAFIISEPETHDILYLNEVAHSYYGEQRILDNQKSHELIGLTGEDLEWYLSVELDTNSTVIRPIFGDQQCGSDTVLDCNISEFQGVISRIDSINIDDNDSHFDQVAYDCLFSLATQRIETLYQRNYNSQNNIDDILNIVQYVYAADRAFVFEVNPEFGCSVDLYTSTREGYNTVQERNKDLSQEEVERMLGRLSSGAPYCFCTVDHPSPHHKELLITANVKRNMTVPFSPRTKIPCFLSVDNPRRYWKNYSFLSFASFVTANDMHVYRIQEQLTAAQKLNRSITKMSDNDLQVSLLGGFELRSSFGIVQFDSITSLQSCALFVYLLSNRHRVVSVREIAEMLRPNELIENPSNFVKSAIFRMRKALEGAGIDPLIVATKGTYAVNPDLNITLDTEKFEEYCKCGADGSKSRADRLQCYGRALDLYRGDMLPNINADMWLLARTSYYQILYTQMIVGYIMLLSEAGEYQTMLQVAARAMETNALDAEIHALLIDALMLNERWELARKYFSKAEQFLTATQKEHLRSTWAKHNSKPFV